MKKPYKRTIELLGKNHRDKKEKVQLNLISKLLRGKRNERIKERDRKMLQDILENIKSTKKAKKYLSLGNNWATYLIDNKEQKIANRVKIKEMATFFYEKLYNSGNRGRGCSLIRS